MMHRLLKRQLDKLKLKSSAVPDLSVWQQLIDQINTSYEASDQDRYTLERSLTISYDEMKELQHRQKLSYEHRLQSIFNAMPDVLFLLTEEGECIEVMSGNKHLLEINREMAFGKFFRDVYSKQQAEVFHRAVDQAIETEQLVVLYYELEINDRRHYFEGRIMPSKYEYEDKRTVVFIAIDISKKVKADVQKQMISTVFESSKEGLLILDDKLKLISVNEAFCELSNQTMETIDGAIPDMASDFMHTESNDLIKNALLNEGYWIGEVAGHNIEGKSYPLWLTINTIKDHSDKINNYVVMLTDVSAIKRSQEELEHVATHDFLTNLPNRVLFHDRLQQAIKRTERTRKVGALFFLDLDRFKNVNDNLGHQVGDELLIQVSERLKKVCRSADTLARIGGDEFTLIVEGFDHSEELALIAEKILATFVEPFSLGGYNLDISVSIGISVFPQDSCDSIELIKHADTAMYSAKDMGRNTYQYYTQELTSKAFEYFAIEIALRKALKRDQFFLLYQPQYDINSNQLIGVEALLRWRHPEMGVVSPAKFIPIAETSGQIEAIGEWVIAESCRQCTIWDQFDLPAFTLSLNLSRKQLVIPDLSSRVKEILSEQKIDGTRLEFEITESAILDNEDIVYQNLKDFKEMGISMAIDDFGTGYSSLVNLKQFPLSRLKIDQSFVRDVTKDKNDEAIIRATIALGKSLQLKIIAEGVEKEEQRQFLIDEGCDQVQGFLYSEPLMPEQIIELLTGKKTATR